MISEDVNEFDAIIAAMRAWHRTGAAPPPGIGITANPANNVWDMQYGSYGNVFGSIRMNRDNFEVTHVTDAGGNFINFAYNHIWPGLISLPAISTALSQNALAGNHGARSLIILLTSECARSTLVERYVKSLLNGNQHTQASYVTVQALTAEYAHTQLADGGQVGPGPAWAPLEMRSHLYHNSHKAPNVVNLYDQILALNTDLNQY
ncbi:hypothetical protein V8J88_12230 [Massilia sp. W12]|uniref:hypothetical protein n=1 Tax=Massilia sp. W12 TaxID=3126507 RepID=UPI0030CB938F